MAAATIALHVSAEERKILDNHADLAARENPRVDYADTVCVKPWGYEWLVYESAALGAWYLSIRAGHATSMHAHFKKDTFLIVLQGAAKLTTPDAPPRALTKLQAVHIPMGKFHAISSFSEETVLLEIEVFDRTKTFSDKNDLLRIDDQYQRKATGYEASVVCKRASEDLEAYGHFMLRPGFAATLFGTAVRVETVVASGSYTVSADAAHAIVLDGSVFETHTGVYAKEGSRLTPGASYTTGSSAQVLTLTNPFAHEDAKILHTPEHLDCVVRSLKAAGARIVLTSGCYDIVHVGHLRHLQQAKRLGDVLMVCLSSDAQIKCLKGPDRPINTYADRLNLFKTISYVDYIVPYNEEHIEMEGTLGAIMKRVDPYCWTKGSDYTQEAILAKHPYLKKIVLFENVKEKSTTQIIRKIRAEAEGAVGAEGV